MTEPKPVQPVREVDKVVTRDTESRKFIVQLVIAIGTVVGASGIITGQYFAWRTAVDTSRKVETVKDKLEETSGAADRKLDAVHALVNSAFGAQLDVSATFAETIAERSKDPGDIEVAKKARKKHTEHMAAQRGIDADAHP